MSKTILILYSGDDWSLDYPPHKENYKLSYEWWGKISLEQGLTLTRAEVFWFKEGKFERYWEFDKETKRWIKKLNPLLPDAVYDKAKMQDDTKGEFSFDIYNKKVEISRVTKFINNPTSSFLLDNKINQIIAFNKYIPESFFYTNSATIKNPDNKFYVLKKAYGSGGSNVKILNDSEIQVEQDSIVQEFIDAKDDQGLIKDYRFVFFGSDLIYCGSRIAAGESKLTNVSKGAESRVLDINSVDSNLLETAKTIANTFKFIDKLVYSLDFMIEYKTGKPYLIEYNSSPGVGIILNNEQTLRNYYTTLNNYLLK